MVDLTKNAERRREADRYLQECRERERANQRPRRNPLTDAPVGEHPLTGCATQTEAARRSEIAQLGRPMFTCKSADLPVKCSPVDADGVRQVFKGKSLVGTAHKKPKGEWWIGEWMFKRIGGLAPEYFDTLTQLREYVGREIYVHR